MLLGHTASAWPVQIPAPLALTTATAHALHVTPTCSCLWGDASSALPGSTRTGQLTAAPTVLKDAPSAGDLPTTALLASLAIPSGRTPVSSTAPKEHT